MSALDWSGNGSLADEAIWIGSILTFLGTLMTVAVRQGRIGQQVSRIDNTLNHVDEPEPDTGPTFGQRVARIENRTDRIDKKLDAITANLQHLSFQMMEHITDETRRTDKLEEWVRQLDPRWRRREATDGEDDAH